MINLILKSTNMIDQSGSTSQHEGHRPPSPPRTFPPLSTANDPHQGPSRRQKQGRLTRYKNPDPNLSIHHSRPTPNTTAGNITYIQRAPVPRDRRHPPVRRQPQAPLPHPSHPRAAREHLHRRVARDGSVAGHALVHSSRCCFCLSRRIVL